LARERVYAVRRAASGKFSEGPIEPCNQDYRHQDYAPRIDSKVRWYTGEGSQKLLICRRDAERSSIDEMCLAIPGQVVEMVDEVNQIAKVDVVGVRRNINVSLLANDVDGARPGDWVLIHVGFALSKVDEDEAHATLDLLQRMGRDYEQELEELKASVIE
jgi:hydrogenase expression/formation protein HypC